MARKSEQIQIRVTPGQKAALKARARAAGQSLSTYVLTSALPPEASRFRALVIGVADEETRRFALAELNDFLTELTPDRFGAGVGEVELGDLSPLMRNYVAAMVEQAADQKEVVPPGWTREVRPLEEPYFATPLPGLRLHLLKSSPVSFKRRNLFVDSAVGDRV